MAVETTNETSTGMKPTLGLTGVTINAMALIAPGAFLWTTYQLQSAPSSAANMWFAVFVATAIALFTATAYATLAKRYPEAGAGSSYYFAEVAVLQQEEHRHFKFARLSKFVVGWASHLYYWIYPGVSLRRICLRCGSYRLHRSNRLDHGKYHHQCHPNHCIGDLLRSCHYLSFATS